MAVQIKNLNAALGAEVGGVDLSKSLPQADIDAIAATWRERLVVVFHGQNLSDPQLIAFSRNFGELDPPGPILTANRSTRRIRNSTSSPTWLKTASRSAISATAKPSGTPT